VLLDGNPVHDGTLLTAVFHDGHELTLPVTGGKVYFPRAADDTTLPLIRQPPHTAYLTASITVTDATTTTGTGRR
jgi:hypothetical protein